MALTKTQVKEILSAAGVAADKMDDAVNKIIDGHLTSIDALREQRDGYKADADKLPGVPKELDDLKQTVKDAIWDSLIPNDHDAARQFMLQKAAEIGLKPTS